MIKKHLFLFVIFSFSANAQILDTYPKGQDFYEGGFIGFYKDVNEAALKNNLKSCDDSQLYNLKIIVYPENKIKIVKDFDSLNIKKNKCAYDFAIHVVKFTNRWKPAEIQGKKYAAVKDIYFYPNDLVENYQEGYDLFKSMKAPEYKEGKAAFENKLRSNFLNLFTDYHIQGKINLIFDIDENGNTSNPRTDSDISDINFKNAFSRTFKRIKGTWCPATVKNIPIKYTYKVPLNFTITFSEK